MLNSNSDGRMTRKVTCMKRLPVSVPLWKSHRDKWRRMFIWVTTLHSVITAGSGYSQFKALFNVDTSSNINLTFCLKFCYLTLFSSERTSNPAVPQRKAAPPPPRPSKAMVTTAQCPGRLFLHLSNVFKDVALVLIKQSHLCHLEVSTTRWGFPLRSQHKETWVIHLYSFIITHLSSSLSLSFNFI